MNKLSGNPLRSLSSLSLSPAASEDAAGRIRVSWRLRTIPLALLMAQVASQQPFSAQSSPIPTILHSFGTTPGDASQPSAAPIEGTDGNFYGVTAKGGVYNAGTIFKMTPDGNTTILHSFGSIANDGFFPHAGLILGKDGNFYGTTEAGGIVDGGVIFRMTSTGTVTILHSFGDGTVPNDGVTPEAPLVQGKDGNFYGTTFGGGVNDRGTIFKMTSSGVVTILYAFSDGSIDKDGSYPIGGLIQGKDGNFYGSAAGSTYYTADYWIGDGTIFKITPTGKMTILHRFGDGSVKNDGANPWASLIQTPDGTLYGATYAGGSLLDSTGFGNGTAFKISPDGTYTVLHRFADGSVANEGQDLSAGLTLASDGNFYGVTEGGGSGGGGTAFKMTPSGATSILHAFPSAVNSEQGLLTNLIQGSDGNLYGMSTYGGSADNGTAYRFSLGLPLIAPPPPANVTAAAGAGQITLSWTPTLGDATYYVYRGTSPGGESTSAIATAITTTTFVDTGLMTGVTYYYTVRGKNAGGPSVYSNEASAAPKPPAPAGLTATPGNTQITLNWMATTGATSYNIYRGSHAGGEGMTPIATGVTGTSYNSSGLTNGLPYYYVVAAVEGSGVSSPSNEAWAKPQPLAPAAPTNLVATPGSGQVTLTWTASSGALSYKIYRGTTFGWEALSPIGSTSSTTFVNKGLTPGTLYVYYVTAVNTGGVSPPSNEASATPTP